MDAANQNNKKIKYRNIIIAIIIGISAFVLCYFIYDNLTKKVSIISAQNQNAIVVNDDNNIAIQNNAKNDKNTISSNQNSDSSIQSQTQNQNQTQSQNQQSTQNNISNINVPSNIDTAMNSIITNNFNSDSIDKTAANNTLKVNPKDNYMNMLSDDNTIEARSIFSYVFGLMDTNNMTYTDTVTSQENDNVYVTRVYTATRKDNGNICKLTMSLIYSVTTSKLEYANLESAQEIATQPSGTVQYKDLLSR